MGKGVKRLPGVAEVDGIDVSEQTVVAVERYGDSDDLGFVAGVRRVGRGGSVRGVQMVGVVRFRGIGHVAAAARAFMGVFAVAP